ncbi:MAG: transketolase [Planctomycetes bacterium]|nr:transketolase [Planctomycetota bacterium]
MDLATLCVNTIRALSVDAVQRASSGHPGLPLGAAPMAYVLWQRHLRHDPADPAWPDRDRFVLSAGHGSALLYSLLHLSGYDLSLEDLRRFRQWGSRTPGHPERHRTPGVESTTGPLGQGSASAVGLAIAERMLAHRFNRPGHTVVDHRTWALISDGDIMEGVNAEAVSLAGHLRLGRLTFLYDANDVTLDGPLSMHCSEDVAARYEACGWHVQRVEDGDRDLEAIHRALLAARAETERPSLVVVRTTIGYGSPGKAGSAAAHGAPLGDEEVARTKESLGLDPRLHFHVPGEVHAHMREALPRGAAARSEWRSRLEAWGRTWPDLARSWDEAMSGRLPEGWDGALPSFAAGDKVATRVASGRALNAIAERVGSLAGGDADLACSTGTALKDEGDFDGRTGAGRNLHFGVREHAMGAIANGMACHGGLRPYASTFFVFSDYMRPAVRLAALDRLPVIYLWTHDSIGLGEDGATHQPVEHLASLRAMPGLHVVRPADATEAAEAWRYAMRRTEGPTALVLTRQAVPVLDRARLAPAAGLARGAYVLSEPPAGPPAALLVATGSEVHLALEAQALLAGQGVGARVVSMPCWEAFQAQPRAYREAVLPPRVTARVAVEAASPFGWERWVGDRGAVVGVEGFGASAPGGTLLREYGLTAARVAEVARGCL